LKPLFVAIWDASPKSNLHFRLSFSSLGADLSRASYLTAIAEIDTEDCFKLWSRVREAADDDLQIGKRGAKVAGENTTPYSFAQYLAIRDSFADQWQTTRRHRISDDRNADSLLFFADVLVHSRA
jgi:hypothetical protein